MELKGIISKVNKVYGLSDKEKKVLLFSQSEGGINIRIPEELEQSKVNVVVLEVEDEVTRVIDETILQKEDGTIKLPVAKCEFEIRRISYNYEE